MIELADYAMDVAGKLVRFMPMSGRAVTNSLTLQHHVHLSGMEKAKDLEFYEAQTVYYSKEEMTGFERQNPHLLLLADNHDKTYYTKLRAEVSHMRHLFEKKLRNDRQLVITDASECISLIHIIPEMWVDHKDFNKITKYRVMVYQRSAYAFTVPFDLQIILDIFRDASDITYIVSKMHFFKEASW